MYERLGDDQVCDKITLEHLEEYAREGALITT